MKTIHHGIPNHNCFAIIQPYNKEEHTPVFKGERPHVKLIDPKGNEEITALALDVWKFNINELPGAFVKLIYGVSVDQIKKHLLTKYPELQVNQMVSILLLERISK